LLHERVEDVFRDVFADPGISLTDDTTADDIPQWDSLQHVVLLFNLEQAFGVQFAGSEVEQLRNVGDLKRLLAEKGAG
jgi:acyl carrier protein